MPKKRNPTTLGERVLLLRRRANMTQSDLSKASGIGANTIARLERGDIQDLRGQHIVKLGDALGVTPNDLLLLGIKNTDDSKAA